ncbi:MAG: hypothetical protein IT314_04770 [Anaerolineales bacterium]|nr:hypothetical protein [Anaerolineales bacterium]
MSKRVILLLTLGAIVGIAGCSRPEETGKTDEQIAASTATVQANVDALPDDVPIREGALNLKFAAGNTYITYEAPGTVDEIVEFYRIELQSLGWEKKGNSPESPLGGALTILRSKPDKNISVTVQSIPDSENVRVLITVIPK